MSHAGAPAATQFGIALGTRLTDYATFDLRVEGMASGGMGLVVWGPDAGSGGRMLAAKLVRPDKATPERARAFEDEALLWCHLWPHAYIVRAFGLTRLSGLNMLPVLQLEYASQGSVRSWLQQAHAQAGASLSLKIAWAWAQQIAAALLAIHTPDPQHDRPHPLVHADLKPENVLIAGNNTAQLTDLGLARAWAVGSVGGEEAPAAPAAPPFGLSGRPLGEERRAGAQGTGPAEPDLSELPTLRILPAPAQQGAGAGSPLPGEAARQQQQQQLARVAHMAEVLWRAQHGGQHAGPPAGLLAGQPGGQTEGATYPAGEDEAEAALLTRSRVLPPLPLPTVGQLGSRGAVVGTLPYMPPEQWLGIEAVVPASDIYALGVILCELFAGVGGRAAFPHVPAWPGELQEWYAAHRAGPTRETQQRGMPTAAQREQAQRVLAGLDALVRACLAPQWQLRPTASEVLARLGELAERAGEARLEVPEVVAHTAEHEAAFWNNLGTTYSPLGRHEEAERALRRALAHGPTDPDLWANLGATLDDLGRLEEAVEAYREGERRLTPEMIAAGRPVSYTLYNNLGAALRRLRRYAEAVAAYETCLARDPDQPDARHNLALTYAQWAQELVGDPTQRAERLRWLRAGYAQSQRAAQEMPGNEQVQRLARAIAAELRQAEREAGEEGRTEV